MHTISNPAITLELARLRSEQIRRDVRGLHEASSRPSWSRRRRRSVR